MSGVTFPKMGGPGQPSVPLWPRAKHPYPRRSSRTGKWWTEGFTLCPGPKEASYTALSTLIFLPLPPNLAQELDFVCQVRKHSGRRHLTLARGQG